MKDWLKQQATEFTAWIGFIICICAFVAPEWVVFTLGVLLIAIDDVKAAEFVKKIAPGVSNRIDRM